MRKILIINADETMAKQYAFSFEAVKYVVRTARDAAGAIEQMAQDEFPNQSCDAVLVDTEIPTVEAIESVSHLRQCDVSVPIIVLSFSANKELLIELMRRGCSDFIEKPVGFGELYTRIEEDIKKNEQSRTDNLHRSMTR